MKKEIKNLTILILLLAAGIASAQNSGKITGKVVDTKTGDAIVGANVLIKGTYLGAATDLDGDYTIVNVPPGTYSVTASYVGYVKTVTENVKVLIDLTTNVNFKLSETAVNLDQEVVVGP